MVSCQRGGLQHAVGLYLEGQAKGDFSALPLATGLGYWENMKAADIKTGFLTKKLVIDKSLSLYDDQSCQTYTEIWVTNKAEPYVAGVRMRINHDKIAEIEVITTTTGDWGFNVDNFLKYAQDQDWSPIPAERSATPTARWCRPATPTWMPSSKPRSTSCRGAIPASASRAACSPAATPRRTPARPACPPA